MTTANSTIYNPELLDIIDESFERTGLDPSDLTGRHVHSAKISLNLLFAEWSARGIHQFRVDQQQQTMVVNEVSFTLPSGTLDVLSAVIRRSGADMPMTRLARSEYLDIPKKTITSRPNQFFVDKQLSPPVFKHWPAAENSTDIIIYDRIMRMEDVTLTEATYTSAVPYLYLEAMVAGLAAKLAEKFAPARWQALKMRYEQQFRLAYGEDRDRGDTSIAIGNRRR